MKSFSQKLLEKAKKPTYEKLDPKPIAIIASSHKQPETLSQAVARILDASLNEEDWEKVRGAEYDFSNDDELDYDEGEPTAQAFERGEIEHDDVGYFERDNEPSTPEPEQPKRKQNTKKANKKTPSFEETENEQAVELEPAEVDGAE